MATNRETIKLWGMCERWATLKEQYAQLGDSDTYGEIIRIESDIQMFVNYVKKKREARALQTEPNNYIYY